MRKYMMVCKKCGGTKFSFRWEFENKEEEIAALFAHDGFGLRVEDAIIRCETCGAEAPYEEEDFIEIKEVSSDEQ